MAFCRFMILTGDYPYEGRDDQPYTTVGKIMQAQYVLPTDLDLSDSAKDLLRQLFSIDPVQRISIRGIKQHPWFTKALPVALEARSSFFFCCCCCRIPRPCSSQDWERSQCYQHC